MSVKKSRVAALTPCFRDALSRMVCSEPRGKTPQMKRILVIEDDKDIVEFVRYNLEKDGYQVTASGDGATGLAQIRKSPPDLLVLDLMLAETFRPGNLQGSSQGPHAEPPADSDSHRAKARKPIASSVSNLAPTITSPNLSARANSSLASKPCFAAPSPERLRKSPSKLAPSELTPPLIASRAPASPSP